MAVPKTIINKGLLSLGMGHANYDYDLSGGLSTLYEDI